MTLNRLQTLLSLSLAVCFTVHPVQSVQAAPGDITRISIASDGTQGNHDSIRSVLSADGKFIAFESSANNLVAADTNGTTDVFVRDLVNGTTTRVSVASDGTQGNNGSANASISADGRYVAFNSYASNLVAGDNNGWNDIFVHDCVTHTTTRISVGYDGLESNGASSFPSISGDGQYVAFESMADNLVSGDVNVRDDVFVYDRINEIAELVSVSSGGIQGNQTSADASISGDGRYIAFESGSSNLIVGDSNGLSDVFVHDRTSNITTRVSIASDGTQGNSSSGSPAISADGRCIAFESQSTNLVNDVTSGLRQIFLHDRIASITSLISASSGGVSGNNAANAPSVSADGRFIAFYSPADNLVPDDHNNVWDIFVRDRVNGVTTNASLSSSGSQANSNSSLPSISGDGRFVVFHSGATNLVTGDTNQRVDVFMHETTGSTTGFTISGRVADTSGDAISGVSISTGSGNSTTTDANGNYALSGLTQGNYVILPSKSGYNLAPPSSLVTVTDSDVMGINFTGSLSASAKQWLIMYYLAGDNNLGPRDKALLDLLKKYANRANFNIAVMIDTEGDNGSQFYYIADNIVPTEKGELNSGSPSTLVDFINWARGQFPTRYSALIIDDHGSQTGVAQDVTSSNDQMDLKELGNAFHQIVDTGGKIDIVYMKACLMGTIEAGYELRRYADYYVASEQLIWMDSSLSYLDSILPTTRPEELAINIAQDYHATQVDSDYPHTISVAHLSSAQGLAEKVSVLAGLLRSKMADIADILLRLQVLQSVQRFETSVPRCSLGLNDEALDLYDFARLVNARSTDLELQNAAIAVMQAIETAPDKYIIYNEHFSGQVPSNAFSCPGSTWNLDQSHGVSIFFSRPDNRRSFYTEATLAFALGTDWGAIGPLWVANTVVDGGIEWGPMLVEYTDQISPNAADDPTPPDLVAPLPSLSVVSSLQRADPNPTDAASIQFTVVFSEAVTGLKTIAPFSDFTLYTTGVTGAAITGVSGTGITYTVTVNTGSGDGTIRLDLMDNNTIIDAVGNPLGGTSIGDGDFTGGEEYTIVKSKPAIPLVLSPLNSQIIVNLQPTLDWKDSIPALHHYQLQVSTNNTFTALVLDKSDILMSDFTFISNLDPGKRYFWRVRAFNILDQTKGWSTVWNFKTPLDKPTLGTPTCGASLLTDRPVINWGDVNGAASYTLQVAPTTSFGTLLLNATVPASEYAMSKDLPQNKTLYWRVKAQTPVVSSLWSEKCSFTTGNPPIVPVLASPANNALLKNYTPALKWYKSSVPSGTLFKRYELQLDDNSDFSSPEIEFSTSDGILVETTFTPPSDLAPNTKYYWRVRAVNLVGVEDHVSGWSVVRSFRTIMLPPVLLLPANGSTEVTLKPLFDWEEVDGATSYTIQISASPGFGTFLVNMKVGVSNFTPTTNLPKNKTIYWRVRANGPNGPSAWSKYQFTTLQ